MHWRHLTLTLNPGPTSQVCWGCEHTLASASEKDAVVRLYNFDTEDNYVLQPEAPEGAGGGVNRIACLASDLRCGAGDREV